MRYIFSVGGVIAPQNLQSFRAATLQSRRAGSELPRIELFAGSLGQYTDVPIQERFYIEDIDSFQKVRDVYPAMVRAHVPDGFLSVSEDRIQTALEQILDIPFHRKVWGGEINDLYTANVVVNGARRASAFLLKGPGIGKKVMEIADCGKRGDQIVRLFETPAELFIVQHVGPIADLLIKDVQGKIENLRASGKDAHFLIMDGQDTARLLHAYGKLDKTRRSGQPMSEPRSHRPA